MTVKKRSYPIFLLILALCGCGVVSPLRNGTTGGGGPTGGKLYVSTNGSILRFGNALMANGNVAPDVTISGSASQLNSPKRIFLDVGSDRLFVANQGSASVLIFSPASTASAGSSPSVVLTSTSNMSSPVDLAIDSGANLLYVADGSNILVFSGEASLSGNVNTPPTRIINFPFTVNAISLDVSANTLLITDSADNAVDILPNASTASGSGALLVSGQVTGSSTTISAPEGATLDSNGRVIVSNGGTSAGILIFTNLVIPSGGNTGPVATINGNSTQLAAPGHLFFNSSQNNGELYVADQRAPGILIFTNINSASGSITAAPTRTIVGAGTLLNANAVNGVALDTTR